MERKYPDMDYLLSYLNKTIHLDPETMYSIGRDSHNNIQLPAPNVSRQHSMIHWKDQCFFIEDLKSTNGTWVNGQTVDEKPLEDGDRIQIGSHYMEYKILNETRDFLDKKTDTKLLDKKIEDILDELSNLHVKQQVLELKDYFYKNKEELKKLAFKDKLTNLFNRRFFDEKLVAEWERAKRYDRELSLIMVDIDHFKNINDKYGHPEGDRALKVVANLIVQTIRQNDIPARYGGEEIVIILPEATDITALKAAEKLRLNIETQAKAALGFELTISAGVAGKGPCVQNVEQMIELADKALYYSKDNGRNRVSLYNQSFEMGGENKWIEQ